MPSRSSTHIALLLLLVGACVTFAGPVIALLLLIAGTGALVLERREPFRPPAVA